VSNDLTLDAELLRQRPEVPGSPFVCSAGVFTVIATPARRATERPTMNLSHDGRTALVVTADPRTTGARFAFW
jgi:hypothetical protein